MIKARGQGPVYEVDVRGSAAASATPEVLDALTHAEAIVIGPSNPVASIAPILAIPGVRAALERAAAPVVAVSPLVHGQVVKGPTAAFMEAVRQPLDSGGIAGCYDGLIDGLVADERTGGLPVLETETLMDSAAARNRLAEETLDFARALA
jgi:LPPG:FO 2-phospho-L-lactate transferase